MLRPLSAEDFNVATDLLVEGFPERGRAFWREALATLQRCGDPDLPIGFLLLDKDSPAGVVLTPSSLRRRSGGEARKFVNLSSWYVRPRYRWRSGPMLKSVVADAQAVHIDLTPTDRVKQMLPAFGFEPISIGIEVAILPLVALSGGGSAVVRAATAADWPSADGPDWALIERHREFGCAALMVDGPAGSTRVVYQIVRRRGLRVARLVYVESHERLRPAMGRLARHLLGRGCAILRLPAKDARVGFGSIFLRRGVWYAKGDDFADRTDVLGTELILFDI